MYKQRLHTGHHMHIKNDILSSVKVTHITLQSTPGKHHLCALVACGWSDVWGYLCHSMKEVSMFGGYVQYVDSYVKKTMLILIFFLLDSNLHGGFLAHVQ